MITAFVLIIAKSGTEKEVTNALRDMDEIKEVKIVYGQYDIVVKIELEDISALNGFLLNRIRPITGVEDSSTLISAY